MVNFVVPVRGDGMLRWALGRAMLGDFLQSNTRTRIRATKQCQKGPLLCLCKEDNMVQDGQKDATKSEIKGNWDKRMVECRSNQDLMACTTS